MEQMKAMPLLLSASPATALVDGGGWGEKHWSSVFSLWRQGVLRCLLQDFVITQKEFK